MKLKAFNLGMSHLWLPPKLLLIMNLVIVLMTTCLLQVSAVGFAQRLTYSQKNVSLEQVFKEITKQTGYEVFYADKGMNSAKKINADFKNANLTDVMDKLLLRQSLSYTVEDKSIVIRVKEKSFFDKVSDYFNVIDVNGRILDENGNPLPGATIKVKGNSKSTQTNGNGEFRLSGVDENAVLVVNYLGYKTKELTVGELKANASVKLDVKAGELDEVQIMVSTGYQVLPKERVTGSFTHISNEMLNEQVGKNIIARLNGIANSVSFNPSVSTRPDYTIRGLSSITGNKAPLVILDNFPYEGSLDNINPNDVESVSILKDAQASSIWGARAGNGVIVIVTKKGTLNKPLQVNFNSNVTVTGKPDLFDLKLANTSDFIDIEQFLFSKGRYKTLETDKNRPQLSKVVELLIANSQGKLTDVQAKAGIDALRGIDVRNDASKYLYNTGVDQQYSIGFQGGSEKSAFHVSAGYDRNLSTLSAANDRINLRAANLFKPVENLQINTIISYTNGNSKSGKPGYRPGEIGRKVYPYSQLKDENGHEVPIDVYRKLYADTAGLGLLKDWKYYPLQDYKNDESTSNLQSILANVGLNYQFLKGLSVDLKYQYENQQIKTRNLHNEDSFFARDLINRGSVLNRNTGVVKYVIPEGGILSNAINSMSSQNARAQLNFDRTFGDHAIAAIAGGELRSTHNTSSKGLTYGYLDDILKTGKVNYVDQYVDFLNGSRSFLGDGLGFEDRTQNYVSAFGNAAYTYKGKYTLSGSIRKDQSNIFGVNTNKKGVPLWSAGASWNISEESFYHISFLPYLKLRSTYGSSGNLDTRQAAVTTFVAAGSAFYTNLPQSSVYNYPNPELGWEKVKMFNIGADFQLINNVLSGSIEYYQKRGSDLFGLAEMDYTTTGVKSMVKNVANMKGKGVDMELNSVIFNRGIKWRQNFNFSYNVNEITKYYTRSLIGNDFVNDGVTVSPLVGQPVYAIVSQRWAGLDPLTGDPQGYLNGVVSKDYAALRGIQNRIEDMVFSGSALPTVFGNFTNTISWKALTLSVNVTYKMGYYFRRASVDYNDITLLGIKGVHSDYASRWQKAGDEKNTNVPSFTYPGSENRNSFYSSSESLVSKGDHIRLQFINLAYSLTKSQMTKLPFKALQVYANASNLGVLWKANKFDIDPDYNNNFNPRASFALGLRANF